MKKFFICLLIIMPFVGMAQHPSQKVFEATKQSLAGRAMPQWFGDAKLGIFIH